ncbi:MAG: protocatechuate 3,4-dioxygenase subunit alpha [Minwuia sp.]|uniref:protocatechuate 3,4-dioxygenase subunit alpha n=1 Tax=Minwuia sp. TaxID=2493630 RepID=UPI003A8BBD44
MKLKQTPSQTIGPFFSYGLAPDQYAYKQMASAAGPELAADDTAGEHIRLVGRVFDGKGDPVSDALIEIWQADAAGRHRRTADDRAGNNPFTGFGRCGTGTDPQNRFVFRTVKPGAAPEDGAPHVNLIVFMRGLLQHVYTRAYFSDEAEANAADAVLQSVPEDRRGTLVAERQETPDGIVYRFDIHMQGERETVFFDV